ncbi:MULTISPECIES: helix-turn-helix domain-containing protein [Maribacter]|jgi:AraC-like DNA-binding protein|uniref:helix-turn-helix domain-containing protein n=1 Tax=Maribacter TaxID=252356 RepID=UPI00068EC54B|nr:MULTISPECIES: AraC family transcriptional regulator [Maribacter]|tara:strand:- start:1686 stop:2657 length:972 start_codon:yes stop_codon:yes gene_type:complete
MNIELLRKEIRVKELFENSYINNSVQFNEVEVTTKDNTSFIRGADFSNTKLIQQFDSEICVTSDEHLIKFHFSLEGAYNYQPLRHIKYLVQIPENHCNMFYYPTTEGRDIFFKSNAKLFEIYVKPSLLQNLLGTEFENSFKKLKEAIVNSNSFVLWDKSKFIPPNIRSKINEIIQCPYKGEIRKTYLESKLTVLLIDFLLGRQTSKLSKNNIKLLNSDYLALVKVEAYIRNNLKEPLKILDLADIAGFNTTKLKRDFKKVYGVPVFKYITALRMEAAKSLITQDGATIAFAAYEVGYANPQHFTTAFKRTMGYLPSELKPAVE